MPVYDVRITTSAQSQLDGWEQEYARGTDENAADAYIEEFIEDARTLSHNPFRGTAVQVGGNHFRQITGLKTGCRIAYEVDQPNKCVDILEFSR